MTLALVAVLFAAAAPLHFAGSSTRSRAALLGLERRYGAGEDRNRVYIESGSEVPAGLTTVLRQPVEVLSRGELMARYAGHEFAPELTTVSVAVERGPLGLRYSVTVSSSGLPVPGANAIPWGGTQIYHFRQWGGLLWSDGKEFIAH